jgi:simple sugar transport system ATP-binding protein
MDQGFLDSWTGKILNHAGVRASPQDPGDSFSGGMLQRLILAREFAEDASLLVIAEPGWGLDGLSRGGLIKALEDYAGAGGGVLLFSSDADELLFMADEIAVLRDGNIQSRRSLEKEGLDRSALREQIGRDMAGAGDAPGGGA